VEESLRLFEEMNSGRVEPGKMVLRAKIDMASDNMHFRDPIMYRVLNMPHIRTGNKWNAYPMYDLTHGQSDYLEGVTHSICTLEFVPHRPLYDLFVDWYKETRGEDLADNRPRQIEFNKLNLNYTLMSKRNLLLLTKEGVVSGWDDPRMPTICGIRRRGYSPESIRKFIDKIGYTTFDALNDIKLLESAVRADLNERATRVSAVLDPVKLIITNYPEELDAHEADLVFCVVVAEFVVGLIETVGVALAEIVEDVGDTVFVHDVVEEIIDIDLRSAVNDGVYVIEKFRKIESFGLGKLIEGDFSVDSADNIHFKLRLLGNRTETEIFGPLNIVVFAVAADKIAELTAVTLGLARSDAGNIL